MSQPPFRPPRGPDHEAGLEHAREEDGVRPIPDVVPEVVRVLHEQPRAHQHDLEKRPWWQSTLVGGFSPHVSEYAHNYWETLSLTKK